ncbi:hypothetical protein [Paenibacillus tundrae]
MEKVKVTKAQKERLDYFTGNEHFNANGFIREHAHALVAPENQCLNELDSLDMAQCLLVGYEVEQTADEKLQELFTKAGGYIGVEEQIAFRHAMAATLGIKGIKVTGINE